MNNIIQRMNYIRKTEGWGKLAGLVLSFLIQNIYFNKYYYLIEHTITNLTGDAFKPRLANYSARFVSTIEDADRLVSEGSQFYATSRFARESLRKGAVAFCVLVGTDIAHIGWLASNEEGKNAFAPYPYHIDFKNGEACTGGTKTLPKYEGEGLMTYGYYKRFEYLYQKGFTKSRNIVETGNTASLKVHDKFPGIRYARVHSVKFLWWRSWQETPINS